MTRALACSWLALVVLFSGVGSMGTPLEFPDQWVDTGLCGKYIFSLAASPDYLNDKTVFAGSHGLFMTKNGGLSWQALSSPSNSGNPTSCLAISPSYASDRTVFVGTRGAGLLVTRDGGLNWVQVQGIATRYISALAAATSNTILVGTDGAGAFRTTDGGLTWSPVQGISNLYITSLAAASTSIIFASTSGGGMFKSMDGGASWTATRNPEWNPGYPQMYITSLAASPNYANDKTLFAGGDQYAGAVWVTKDDGTSWRRLHDPWVTLLSITCLAVSKDGTTLFFGTGYDAGNSGLYMTTDYGMNWTHMGTSIVGMYDWGAMSLTLTSDNTLFVGTWSGVWTNALISIPPVPPSSQITAPLNGAAIRGTILAITGTASANCPNLVGKVELSINSGPWQLATGTSAWSYPWSLPSDGNYAITSRTTDNAGIVETSPRTISVTVDNTKPSSRIRNATLETMNGIRYLLIVGTATDGTGAGVARVQVGFAGASRPGITLPPAVAIPGGIGRPVWVDATGTLHWYFKLKITPAMTPRRGVTFRIRSRATDRAGNVEIPSTGTPITVP
jgi:photosystem II stability/assembly factor-like uncharacterized protein